MGKIDITMSVLIDNAVSEYKNATERIINDLGISGELAEIALERVLSDARARRLNLYATAMYAMGGQKKEGDLDGNTDD